MLNYMNNQSFPEFSINEDYCLREQSLIDTEAFFEYYTDPEVGKFILATKPVNLEQAHQEMRYCHNMFYNGSGMYWTIARKDNNRMIGAVGLYFNQQHQRAEICYDLHRSYWRQGIMSKALYHAVHYVFSHLSFNRIEALTLEENIASIRTLQKLGFELEGTLRNYRYFQGRSHDVYMLGITPEMFAQHCQKQMTADAAV